MPAPDAAILSAAADEREYLEDLPEKSLNWRHNHYLQRANQRRKERPESETPLFSNVLAAGNLNSAWQEQVVLLQAYIVDFYRLDPKVAIEVDGRDHLTDPQLFVDQVRDSHLKSKGIRVLRLFAKTPYKWDEATTTLITETNAEIEAFLSEQ